MSKSNFLAILVLSTAVGLGTACSGGTTSTPNTTTVNSPATNGNIVNTANVANTHAGKTDDEIPQAVKAVFPNAQSITKQHKDIPKEAVAGIEKDGGGKIPDTDHHSYLAFSSTGGARKQIGAATVIKADGKDVVIVYENKEGSPYIKEVRVDGVPAAFLAQFVGKGHDDKFIFGNTIKANGVDETAGKAMTSAIAVDVMTMQALYGAAHSH